MANFTTVNKSSSHFSNKIWTGTGSNATITGVGFQPDMFWVKQRSGTQAFLLWDAIRGGNYYLNTNNMNAHNNNIGTFTAASDGYTFGTDGAYNGNGSTYVGWNWKANGSGSANTDGSINSTVSANTTAGFSIVQFTGNGTDGATVGHGLGATPAAIIFKNITDSSTAPWAVYHQGSFGSQSNPNIMYLQDTGAEADDTNILGASSVTLNSTVFSLGDYNGVNGNTNSIIAYCFAEIPGYSKFGGYDGNNNVDGVFQYCGFRPSWVLFRKREGENWSLYDDKRKGYNPQSFGLRPNTNLAESEYGGAGLGVDFLSNGFKIREGGTNINNGSYIYMAFGQTIVGTNNTPANAR